MSALQSLATSGMFLAGLLAIVAAGVQSTRCRHYFTRQGDTWACASCPETRQVTR